MRIAYFDCFAGASGDMLLGALLDAGAPIEAVRADIAQLRLPGAGLDVSAVTRAGIRATKVSVTQTEPSEERDHAAIAALIEESGLDAPVKQLSLRVFEHLAKAEATVHGMSPDHVHFHEVGAVDSIIDIVGCASAFLALRLEEAFCSPLPLGSGFVETAHGIMPVPVPAVTELLAGVPVTLSGEGETVTPTGAAFLVSVCESFGVTPPLQIHATGWGAGDREMVHPNSVRVLIGETTAEETDHVTVIEATIDDMTPEIVAFVLERLLENGALDAWVAPVSMKKGRLGYVISALADPSEAGRVTNMLLYETTTFGVRQYDAQREVLDRSWKEVIVEGHPVRMKLGTRGGEVVTSSPEYDDAVRVARATGLPLKEIYRRAQIALESAALS
ncbi:MAG TPA: nickel pincer cofactor biosynthesis protein LarC [Actinomycetota bacterium]|nr:nickel pincer cofactor biosynthesis protein LarC [Actinomycetota bacterium]